ncbi:hypothetical protein [Thermococcus aciditolerans]|uniref:Uncharacterized protein n=1 Tax=Thermococcus aciditolerans TaxID=2598455 RepID=A0A5C0SJ74_9EURY|nr:hypothetical protein [Thermococcus aciditolerans]QEK14575.1 hypothetical protein FPV09_05060 [Thermococcus aciditolerans]
MSSSGDNWVSGFNPFDESTNEIQRRLEFEFRKKVITELVFVPFLIWSLFVLLSPVSQATDVLEIDVGAFHIRGSAAVVFALVAMLLLFCRFPSIWYDMYLYKREVKKAFLEFLKQAEGNKEADSSKVK